MNTNRNEIDVQPSVLLWALNRAGVDLRQRFPRLNDWLSGTAKPTLQELERFAEAVSVPLGYLFLPEPPKEVLPIPHYPTVGRVKPPSPDLLETIRVMQRRQEWMREYLMERGQEPLSFVRSASVCEYPGGIAERIREFLGLDVNWTAAWQDWADAFRELRERAESAGILVAISGVLDNNPQRELSVEEFRGFVLADEYAPLIFINGADAKAAQMFTLAYGLSHIWLGSSASFDLRDLQPAPVRIEDVCDQIAAELLMARDELWRFWQTVQRRPDRIQIVARQFGMSEIVAARRALDLCLISRGEFTMLYENYRWQEYDEYHGDGNDDFCAAQNLRLGRRFGETIVRATQEEELLYSEAYRLTGLYGQAFEDYKRCVQHTLEGSDVSKS